MCTHREKNARDFSYIASPAPTGLQIDACNGNNLGGGGAKHMRVHADDKAVELVSL